MKITSLSTFTAITFIFAFAMVPGEVSASKVGEIIKVNSPPGTVEFIENHRADRVQEAIPYWDSDLPNSDDDTHTGPIISIQ